MSRHTEANLWRALEVFQAIARCGGFREAQDALRLSQSTVSNHVANLEVHLGYPVCRRGRKGFQLTERGKAVLDSYARLELSRDRFDAEVRSLKDEARGRLRVGMLDHTMTENMFSTVEVVAELTRRAPKVELHLVQDTQLDLHDAVIDEQLDLGIGVHVTDSRLVKAHLLYHELHHVYCGARHPFFDLPTRQVTRSLMEQAHWVTNGYPPGTFSLLPFPVRNASIVATNIESVAVAILAGAHLGYLPQHFAEKYEQQGLLKRLRQRSYSQKVDISVMTKTGRRQSVATRLFQEICIEQIRGRS